MDNLTHEAEKLYNDVKKYRGTNHTPQNDELERRTRKLYDDFRGQINPRELERQATEIKEFLYHGLMRGCLHTQHCSNLKSGYEHLRIGLRQFE